MTECKADSGRVNFVLTQIGGGINKPAPRVGLSFMSGLTTERNQSPSREKEEFMYMLRSKREYHRAQRSDVSIAVSRRTRPPKIQPPPRHRLLICGRWRSGRGYIYVGQYAKGQWRAEGPHGGVQPNAGNLELQPGLTDGKVYGMQESAKWRPMPTRQAIASSRR